MLYPLAIKPTIYLPTSRLLMAVLCLLLTVPLLAKEKAQESVTVKVLAWNKTFDDISILVSEGPVELLARRGQISPAFHVPVATGIQITRSAPSATPDQEAPPAILLNIPITDLATQEFLLLLAEVDGEMRGNLIPFSESQIAYNTLTVFNYTQFPVAAEIDKERHSLPPHNRLSIPYQYDASDKEALKTRFAVKTPEGWDLVQNGFIPIIPQGRILFFISEDMPSSAARRIRPVRFTYVFEIQSSEENRRQRNTRDLIDPNQTYEPAPF